MKDNTISNKIFMLKESQALDLASTTNTTLTSPPDVIIDPKISAWLNSLEEQPTNNTTPSSTPKRFLLFNLTIVRNNDLYIELVSSKLKKDGGYAKTGQVILLLKNLWDYGSEEARRCLTEDEWDIITYLGKNATYSIYNGIPINFQGSTEFLKRLLNTGRCFINSRGQYDLPLSWGSPKSGLFQWNLVADKDAQKLDCVLEDSKILLLKSLDSICYYDEKNRTFGLVDFKEEQKVAKHL